MNFPSALVAAKLIKRYKRFLADVEMISGQRLTVYCPNTGSMMNCAEPGSRVWLSQSDNAKRKYGYTWELVETEPNILTCIHSGLANKIVKEGIEGGLVAEVAGFDGLQSEVCYGKEGSRVDFLLSNQALKCYLEVKCVTLHAGEGWGLFPDSVSTRASRHLRELASVIDKNTRALLLFFVQNNAIQRVAPAAQLDPVYSQTLQEVMACGVEVIAYQADVSTERIVLGQPLPFFTKADVETKKL